MKAKVNRWASISRGFPSLKPTLVARKENPMMMAISRAAKYDLVVDCFKKSPPFTQHNEFRP